MNALSLLSLLLVSAAPQDYAQPAPSDPAVRVWTDNEDGYAAGDLARVYVRAQRDGYLVVLHADPNGTVRILFPVDPVDDDFVRGGESLEVRGRGDREAFLVDEVTGTGIVVAAWSEDPFRFDGLVRGDHWDYRMIAPDGVRRDLEAGLVDIVHRMAGGRPFEYDASPYFVRDTYREAKTRVAVSVGTHVGYCAGCYGPRIWPRSGFSLSINIGGFGFDYWRYRPWHYDPWYHWSPSWSWWAYHYRPYPVVWHRHRAVWVYDPFVWHRVPRYHYPRIGVRVHYAGCWGDPFCYRDRHWRSRPGIATGTVLAGNIGRGWGEGVGLGGGRLSSGIGAADGIGTGRDARPRDGSFDGSATGRIGGVSSDRSAAGRIGGSSASSDRNGTGRIGGTSSAGSDRGATGRIGGSSSSSTDRAATGRIGGSSSSSTDRAATGRIGGSPSSSTDRRATGRIGGSSSSSTDRAATGRIGGSSSSSTDRRATGRIGGSSSLSTDRAATGRIGGSSSSSTDRRGTGRIGGSSSSYDRGAADRMGGSRSSGSSDRGRSTGRIGGSSSSSDRARIIAPSSSGRLRDSARPSGPSRPTSVERPSSRSGSISGGARSSRPPSSVRSAPPRSGGAARSSGRATSRGSSSGRSGGRIGGN